jgi:hypothetical protein
MISFFYPLLVSLSYCVELKIRLNTHGLPRMDQVMKDKESAAKEKPVEEEELADDEEEEGEGMLDALKVAFGIYFFVLVQFLFVLFF